MMQSKNNPPEASRGATATIASLSSVARSMLWLSDDERHQRVLEYAGDDAEKRERLEARAAQLEALHDPLLGPATDEQLRLLLASSQAEVGADLFPAGYRVKQLIGQGRFGDVYEAVEIATSSEVALKVVRGGLLAGVSWADVQREVSSARRVVHANVLWVQDAACFPTAEGPDFYMAMPLVRNARPITAWTAATVPLGQKLEMLQHLSEAVHAAHAVGVLHGDLSPNNVLTDEHGAVHLVDFGLASRLSTGGVAEKGRASGGTPGYMAPELTRPNADVTCAADVFSFGALAFEVLLGQPLRHFAGDCTQPQVLAAVRETRPDLRRLRASGLPEDLQALVKRCLAWDPSERFGSVDEIVRHLRNIRAKKPVVFEGFEPTSRYRILQPVRGRPALFAMWLAACLAVVAGAGIVGSFVGAARAHRLAAQALARQDDLAKTFRSILGSVRPTSQRPELAVVDGLRDSLHTISGDDIRTYCELSGSLALVYWILGDHPDANEVMRTGWVAAKDRLGETDPTTAQLCASYGAGLYHVGEYRTLIELSNDERMGNLQRALGPDAGPVRELRQARCVALSMTGDHDAAINGLRRLHAEETAAHQGAYWEDKQAIRTLEYLGNALLEHGEAGPAEKAFQEVVKVGSQRWGRPDPGLWVSEWLDAHGNALLALGRFDEAGAAFQEAYEQRLAGLGTMNIETLKSQGGVARVRFARATSDQERAQALAELRHVTSALSSLGSRGNSLYLARLQLELGRALVGMPRPTAAELEEAERVASDAHTFFEGHCGSEAARTRLSVAVLQDVRARRKAPSP